MASSLAFSGIGLLNPHKLPYSTKTTSFIRCNNLSESLKCKDNGRPITAGRDHNGQAAAAFPSVLTAPDQLLDRIPVHKSDTRLRIFSGTANPSLSQPTCPPANENLMELLIMIDACRRASAKNITAVIPYFGYARADRKTQGRESIAAKLVANLITEAGADRVLVCDLHSGQSMGYFDIPVDHVHGQPVILDYLASKRICSDDLVVVSPDVGGVARARAFAKKLSDAPLAIVDKRRHGHNVAEVAVMVDDMIDTAGTIAKGAALLHQEGAREVYACSTHAVFSPPAVERLSSGLFQEVIITNTIPVAEQNYFPQLTILSVSNLLGETIWRVHDDCAFSNTLKGALWTNRFIKISGARRGPRRHQFSAASASQWRRVGAPNSERRNSQPVGDLLSRQSTTPSDFKSKSDPNPNSKNQTECAFCAGHEHECAPEIFRFPPDSTSDWKIRVIQNLYPALSRELDPPNSESVGGPMTIPGFGFHDVVIESPAHPIHLTDLSADQIADVLLAYKKRIDQLRAFDSIKFVQVFKNHGASAGASMSHSHSQIMALPIVPPAASARIRSMKEDFVQTGKCGLCQVKQDDLLIDESSHFISIVPFAATFPFEIWIVPRDHSSHFHELDNDKALDLGGFLKLMLVKMSLQLNNPPYNFMIHTAPLQIDSTELPFTHWFIQIVPQLSGVGGFELGTGCYINPVFPEDAAKVLREVRIPN
ncbi:UNVERIFIED_CONTAM: Ribose-phosphate pyrophosphokinase [Sesamum latifolium]|uniref:ribose-phosphate diphosphokinase n=1 Tax=Sesamum latifolium TaxID=2727402 RepID=A0AAW2YFC7_9LAMI